METPYLLPRLAFHGFFSVYDIQLEDLSVDPLRASTLLLEFVALVSHFWSCWLGFFFLEL